MGQEQDFLRAKTTKVFTSETNIVDVATGEILRSEQTSKKLTSGEPDYIKVYYKAMMAINDIDEIPLGFLLALSSQLNYANARDDRIYFYNNRTTRRAIQSICEIGDNMVQKYLRRCREKGILFTTPDRGTYEVNPWLIAKGRWEHIKGLQAEFSFTDGVWKRTIREQTEGEEGQAG